MLDSYLFALMSALAVVFMAILIIGIVFYIYVIIKTFRFYKLIKKTQIEKETKNKE